MESYRMVLLCACSALLAAPAAAPAPGTAPAAAPGHCRPTDHLLPDDTCPREQPASSSHPPDLLEPKVEEDSPHGKPRRMEVELDDDNNQKEEEELKAEGEDVPKVRYRRGLLLGPLSSAKTKRAVSLETEAQGAKPMSDIGGVINTRSAEGFRTNCAGWPLSHLESSQVLMPGDARKARGIWRPGLSRRNSRSRRDLRRNSWLSPSTNQEDIVRPARLRKTGGLLASTHPWDFSQHPLSGKRHKLFDEINLLDEFREESYLPEENAETDLPHPNSNKITGSGEQVTPAKIDTPDQPTRDVRSLRMLQPRRQESGSRLWFPFSDEPSARTTSNGILLPPYRTEDLQVRTPSRRSPKHPQKIPPRKGLKDKVSKTDTNHPETAKQYEPPPDIHRKNTAERYDDREEHAHQSDHQQPPSNYLHDFVQRKNNVPPKSSLRNQQAYHSPSSTRLYHRDHADAYPSQYDYANQRAVEPQRSFQSYQSSSKDINPSQTHNPYQHSSSVSHNYAPVCNGGHTSRTEQLQEHPQAGQSKYEPLPMSAHYPSKEEAPTEIGDHQSKFHALGLENDLRTVWKEIASNTRNQADAIRHSKDEEREGNSFNTKEEVRGLKGEAELGKGLSMQQKPVSSNEVISRLRWNAGAETKHNSEKVKEVNSAKTGTQLTFNQKSEGAGRGEVSRLQKPYKRPAPQPSSEPFSLLPCRQECEKLAGIMHCLGRRAIDISEHLQKLAEAASILEGKVNAPSVKHAVAQSQYS